MLFENANRPFLRSKIRSIVFIHVETLYETTLNEGKVLILIILSKQYLYSDIKAQSPRLFRGNTHDHLGT